MKKVLAGVFIVIMVVSMIFIFTNSSKNGHASNSISYKIANKVKEKVPDKFLSYAKVKLEKYTNHKYKDNLDVLNFLIRKLGHFSEYMILSIFIYIVLGLLGFKSNHKIVYVLFICLLYAVLDEFHQGFVDGRSSKVADIIIDFIGAGVGTGIGKVVER